MTAPKPTLLDAVEQILKEAAEPLKPKAISQRLSATGQWSTGGKTPDQTVHARLAMDIKQRGDASRFIRTAPGTFALRSQLGSPKVAEAKSTTTLSFTDAAQWVLEQSKTQKPTHYKAITEQARAAGKLKTGGLTPESTMYVQLISEIDRRAKRGDQQRFTRHPKGLFGLVAWQKSPVSAQVADHNRKMKQHALERLLSLSAKDFESLVASLLTKMGLRDVTNTQYTGDGGVDARGTLVVGDVVRIKVAIQAKRWRNNVQSPIVQQMRGALGAHEQGLIITTSGFGNGAREEASRPDAAPVGLVDGEQLVGLLLEHKMGVRMADEAPIELTDDRFGLGEIPEGQPESG